MCIYHNLYPDRASKNFCPITSPLDLLGSLFRDNSHHLNRDRCPIGQRTYRFGDVDVLCSQATVTHHVRKAENLEKLDFEIQCDECQAIIESCGWKGKTLREIMKANEMPASTEGPSKEIPNQGSSDLDDFDWQESVQESDSENEDEPSTTTTQPAPTTRGVSEPMANSTGIAQIMLPSPECYGSMSSTKMSHPATSEAENIQQDNNRSMPFTARPATSTRALGAAAIHLDDETDDEVEETRPPKRRKIASLEEHPVGSPAIFCQSAGLSAGLAKPRTGLVGAIAYSARRGLSSISNDGNASEDENTGGPRRCQHKVDQSCDDGSGEKEHKTTSQTGAKDGLGGHDDEKAFDDGEVLDLEDGQVNSVASTQHTHQQHDEEAESFPRTRSVCGDRHWKGFPKGQNHVWRDRVQARQQSSSKKPAMNSEREAVSLARKATGTALKELKKAIDAAKPDEVVNEVLRTAVKDDSFRAAIEATKDVPVASSIESMSPVTAEMTDKRLDASVASAPQNIPSVRNSPPVATNEEASAQLSKIEEQKQTILRLRRINADVTDQLADAQDGAAKVRAREAALTKTLADERRVLFSDHGLESPAAASNNTTVLTSLEKERTDLRSLRTDFQNVTNEKDQLSKENAELRRRIDTLEGAPTEEKIDASKKKIFSSLQGAMPGADRLKPLCDGVNAVVEMGQQLGKTLQELCVEQTMSKATKQEPGTHEHATDSTHNNERLKTQIEKFENTLAVAEAKAPAAAAKEQDDVTYLKQENTALRRECLRLDAEKNDAEARDAKSAEELINLRARTARGETSPRPVQTRSQAQISHQSRYRSNQRSSLWRQRG